MKSERRHELQQNSLARSLENLPKMGRDSGSKLLLGIVLVLLVIVLIRFYLNNREQKQEQIASQLANARVELNGLQGEGGVGNRGDDTALLRNEFFKKVEGSVAEVLSAADDGPQVAQARNIRADAYLQMATIGQPAEATTRPDLALPRKPNEMLDEAAHGYQEVLEIKNGVPPTEVADARFGLAAVAENRGDWAKAREQYDTIVSDGNLPQLFHDLADTRRSLLDKISKPIVLGEPSTQPFESRPTAPPVAEPAGPPRPAGLPAAPTTGPATGPATNPATGPAAPAMAPTTAPSAVTPGVPPLGWTTGPASPAAPTTAPTTKSSFSL